MGVVRRFGQAHFIPQPQDSLLVAWAGQLAQLGSFNARYLGFANVAVVRGNSKASV